MRLALCITHFQSVVLHLPRVIYHALSWGSSYAFALRLYCVCIAFALRLHCINVALAASVSVHF